MAEEAKWYVVHTYSGYENTVTTTRSPMENGDCSASAKNPMLVISSSVRGTGFEPGPTKPVTPRVFLLRLRDRME